MPFHDRQDAGNRLAAHLETYRQQNVLVLALPRGGVEVAVPIAQQLDAPLELLLVRKIGVPGYGEVAMGAIVDGEQPIIVRNDDVLRHLPVPDAVFDATAKRELAEIERRRAVYYAGRKPLSPDGKVAIVVDDGVATGATLKAALAGLRRKRPSKIVVAVPVAPTDLVEGTSRRRRLPGAARRRGRCRCPLPAVRPTLGRRRDRSYGGDRKPKGRYS